MEEGAFTMFVFVGADVVEGEQASKEVGFEVDR